MGVAWNQEEKDVALKLKAEGRSLDEIGAALNRTRASVEGFFCGLKRTEEYRLRKNAQARVRYALKMGGLTRRPPEGGQEHYREPHPAAVADRDYRLSLPPRDLTAMFFGDPPPGYSALERRGITGGLVHRTVGISARIHTLIS